MRDFEDSTLWRISAYERMRLERSSSVFAQLGETLDQILEENPLKGEYYLPFAVDHGLKNGLATVKVLPSDDRWYGVTYLEDKPSVMAAMKDLRTRGLYPERLW